MSIIVWGKDNCMYCDAAKKLLKSKNMMFEERVIGDSWTREQLLEVAPEARTVPQIFIDDTLIGGYTELKKHLEV